MAIERPYCFDASFLDGGVSGDSIGLQDNGSLGVDCHSCTAGSIISEAKLGLQDARNHFNEFYMKQGKIPRKLPDSLSVQSAFNLATIKGAEATNMSDKIRRISEGYEADLVIFDALSPSMVGAAQHDPVAAVILHSSPADITTVIVGGVVRKQNGRLLPVSLDGCAKEMAGRDMLEWNSIAREVIKSREKMQAAIDKINFDEAATTLLKVFHVNESSLVDA
ncbi:Nn.00g073100.m01.CDS01 [Neocucurbitaria sp. VM-36]